MRLLSSRHAELTGRHGVSRPAATGRLVGVLVAVMLLCLTFDGLTVGSFAGRTQ